MQIDNHTIEIGFDKMMEQAHSFGQSCIFHAIENTMQALNVTEEEALKDHKDIIITMARCAAQDFSTGTLALVVQNLGDKLAFVIENQNERA